MKTFILAFYISCLTQSAIAVTEFQQQGSSCTFEQFMKNFLRLDSKAPAANSFLVATIAHSDNEYWVFWPQKRELLLIAWPFADCQNPAMAVRRRLNLSKDMVKGGPSASGSTYLETEDWAQNVIFSAAKNGYQTTVIK